MPLDPNPHRVGECGDRLGRESRRLHSAPDGAAGGLPGNGDSAYRDVRCAEFDRAALSALLRPTSGNAGHIERRRGCGCGRRRSGKPSSRERLRYPGGVAKLSGGNPRQRVQVERHQARRGGRREDAGGARQRWIVGAGCLSAGDGARPLYPNRGHRYSAMARPHAVRADEPVPVPPKAPDCARERAMGQGLQRNERARFITVTTAAEEDAAIAVMDAKYKYALGRPITAIRNGDIDGNDATEREATWQPIDNTPMHPEYPCAHCIISSAVASAIEAMLGTADIPEVAMTSPTAPGVTHRWTTLNAYADEVAAARIAAGFHYRFSTVVGQDMGRQIGVHTVKTIMQPLEPTSAR